MGPPTEQLIRDYINRLSVAARGRLSREDRRALMDRTRGYIEHNTGSSGPPTKMEVAGLLTRLGDPALVVAHEVQRLAEIRGGAAEPPPEPRISRLARAIRREHGRLGASWHWPARPGNLADLHAVRTGGRAGAAGSNAAPGESDVGVSGVTGRAAGAGDEIADATGMQIAGPRTGDPENGGTRTADTEVPGPRTGDPDTGGTQTADTEVAGSRTAATQPAGSVAPEPVSGLEALGLVGPRQDDAGGAPAAPGNAGPGGLTPAGPAWLAGLIPPQARESASLNGTLPEAAAPGRFAGARGRAAASPQRPRWPHDPAIRRDAAGGGQAGRDADDHPAVEADDQAKVQGTEAGDLTALSAVGFAAETAEGPVAAGADPSQESGAGDVRAGNSVQFAAGVDARAEPDVTGLSAEGTGELSAEDTGELPAVDTGELPAVDLTAVELEATQAPRLAWIRRAWAAVVGWTRDKTLESVATILLGLGGAIFPPVWLLGAMVALASRVWDYRDKWVGLAIPIVLTIVGTAAGLILTGSQSSFSHDLHVSWVSADISSRISAVLGAAYLAWRSVRGKRPDAVPPWNKPHRIN